MIKVKLSKFTFSQAGSALLITLMILSALFVIALNVAGVIMSSTNTVAVQDNSLRAFYSAEAGVEEALYHIRKEDYNINTTSLALYSGSIDGAPYNVDFLSKTGLYNGNDAVFFSLYSKASKLNYTRAIDVNFMIIVDLPALNVALNVINDDGGTSTPSNFMVHLMASSTEVGTSAGASAPGSAFKNLWEDVYSVTTTPDGTGGYPYTYTYSGDCSATGTINYLPDTDMNCLITIEDDISPHYKPTYAPGSCPNLLVYDIKFSNYTWATSNVWHGASSTELGYYQFSYNPSMSAGKYTLKPNISFDWSEFPAQQVCTAIGGRLPADFEAAACVSSTAPANSYWTGGERDADPTKALTRSAPNNALKTSLKNVFCVKLKNQSSQYCIHNSDCEYGFCDRTSNVCGSPWNGQKAACGNIFYSYQSPQINKMVWSTGSTRQSTSCASPNCGWNAASSTNYLVASNGVDFRYFPARQECKEMGGRLPTPNEIACLKNNAVAMSGTDYVTSFEVYDAGGNSNTYVTYLPASNSFSTKSKSASSSMICVKDP
ncbi:MAG: pilus assembly PilX N-terminal domain-containing protein [Candidatus Falkowbacteria bacterium]